jgi:hypothetical protein
MVRVVCGAYILSLSLTTHTHTPSVLFNKSIQTDKLNSLYDEGYSQ